MTACLALAAGKRHPLFYYRMRTTFILNNATTEKEKANSPYRKSDENFSNTQASFHSWDKSYLVLLYYSFNIGLN